MQRQGISPKHIEYFERDFLDQLKGVIKLQALNIQRLTNNRLFRITELPQFWGERPEDVSKIQEIVEDLVSGFYESRVPILFTIFGGSEGLELSFGTYSNNIQDLEKAAEIVRTSLSSSFHGVKFSSQSSEYLSKKLSELNYSGILTGAPSEYVSEGRVETSDINRLIRGINAKHCGFTVIGSPMSNEEINTLYSMVLNEIRIGLESERLVGQENPTVRQYKALLERYLEKLQISKSQGLWITSCFLYADTQDTLNQLKALTKTAFSGRNSVPDRIRTLNILDGKPGPGLILNPSPASPGQFKWPYMYSSVLGSSDLANLVKLPSEELPGYKIKPYVRFNLSQGGTGNIVIGEILDQGEKTGKWYKIREKGLKKHGLIVGGTGSGKTNTLFYILRELLKENVPFLVLEPAKKEYRKLIFDKGFSEKLNVFTLGDNNVSPFRLNPFTVYEGVLVQTHLDLLKSVFNASFYMWGPLPHVLEQCLYEIYKDKGWDLTSNTNSRGVGKNAFPTLTDLYNKVDEVVDRLGYSPETTMELKSSLKTRLNSLRIGGKGLMLDTKSGIDFKKLLEHPTVLELETIGDDEEKSFIMGLILTMMYEHYISQGHEEDTALNHITIIEEAHRLLGNATRNDAFTGDMKGKAVETFTNILSEIRAYGEGFLIAEQIPTKLSSDVVKNTNLKVMHRIVADDDRRIMAASMNVKEGDAPIASTLSVGEALVFSEGDDGAYSVQVDYAKLGEVKGVDEDEAIRKRMKDYLHDPEYISPYISCSNHCSKVCSFKDTGDLIRVNHNFSSKYPKLLVSILEKTGVEDNLVQMFESGNDEIRGLGDELGIKICSAVQGAENYFEKLGRMYHWNYDVQEIILSRFLDLYIDSLRSYLDKSIIKFDIEKANNFIDLYKKSVSDLQPTKICSRICIDNTCQYRFLLTDELNDEYYHEKYVESINNGGADVWINLNDVCRDAASELNPNLESQALNRISYCFALQKAYQLESFSQRHIETVMDNLIGLGEREVEPIIDDYKNS